MLRQCDSLASTALRSYFAQVIKKNAKQNREHQSQANSMGLQMFGIHLALQIEHKTLQKAICQRYTDYQVSARTHAKKKNLSLILKCKTTTKKLKGLLRPYVYRDVSGRLVGQRSNFSFVVDGSHVEVDLHPSIYAFDAMLRVLLATVLPQSGGLLLHASSVVIGKEAYVFPGPSGAGKTTLSRLLGPDILNDEIVAMARFGKKMYVWGTPFWGEMGTGPYHPQPYELAGFYFPIKRKRLSIHALELRESIPKLLRTVCHFGKDKRDAAQLLGLAFDYCTGAKTFELKFPKDPLLRERFVLMASGYKKKQIASEHANLVLKKVGL